MATNREYTEDFNKNVELAEKAENIAQEIIEQFTLDDLFNVRNEPEFYHIGDLITQEGISYEVKDDGRICETGNVFCEYRKHWLNGQIGKGWMYNQGTNYLCVVDQIQKKIYILDFEKLKPLAEKFGEWRFNIWMKDNYTDGRVIPLWKCKKYGALMCTLKYTVENGNYTLIDWKEYGKIA